MNTSNDSMQPGQQSATSSGKPLWAAVGILGVAVLGMGGAMIYQQRPPAPVTPAAQVAMVTPKTIAPAAGTSAADDMVEKPSAAAPTQPAPVTAKKVVKPKPQPVPRPEPAYAGVSPAPSPYPVQAPVAARQVCTVCGSIESVTPVQRSTKSAGPGVGAVAGGVLGAVLGNQVGQGNGKTAATILGAIGGGFAGNAVEKNVRKETIYEVGVRMEDGSRRTMEVAQPPSVGSRVTLEGSSIRSNDGVTYRAPAPVAASVNQPAFGQPGQQ